MNYAIRSQLLAVAVGLDSPLVYTGPRLRQRIGKFLFARIPKQY